MQEEMKMVGSGGVHHDRTCHGDGMTWSRSRGRVACFWKTEKKLKKIAPATATAGDGNGWPRLPARHRGLAPANLRLAALAGSLGTHQGHH